MAAPPLHGSMGCTVMDTPIRPHAPTGPAGPSGAAGNTAAAKPRRRVRAGRPAAPRVRGPDRVQGPAIGAAAGRRWARSRCSEKVVEDVWAALFAPLPIAGVPLVPARSSPRPDLGHARRDDLLQHGTKPVATHPMQAEMGLHPCGRHPTDQRSEQRILEQTSPARVRTLAPACPSDASAPTARIALGTTSTRSGRWTALLIEGRRQCGRPQGGVRLLSQARHLVLVETAWARAQATAATARPSGPRPPAVPGSARADRSPSEHTARSRPRSGAVPRTTSQPGTAGSGPRRTTRRSRSDLPVQQVLQERGSRAPAPRDASLGPGIGVSAGPGARGPPGRTRGGRARTTHDHPPARDGCPAQWARWDRRSRGHGPRSPSSRAAVRTAQQHPKKLRELLQVGARSAEGTLAPAGRHRRPDGPSRQASTVSRAVQKSPPGFSHGHAQPIPDRVHLTAAAGPGSVSSTRPPNHASPRAPCRGVARCMGHRRSMRLLVQMLPLIRHQPARSPCSSTGRGIAAVPGCGGAWHAAAPATARSHGHPPRRSTAQEARAPARRSPRGAHPQPRPHGRPARHAPAENRPWTSRASADRGAPVVIRPRAYHISHGARARTPAPPSDSAPNRLVLLRITRMPDERGPVGLEVGRHRSRARLAAGDTRELAPDPTLDATPMILIPGQDRLASPGRAGTQCGPGAGPRSSFHRMARALGAAAARRTRRCGEHRFARPRGLGLLCDGPEGSALEPGGQAVVVRLVPQTTRPDAPRATPPPDRVLT